MEKLTQDKINDVPLEIGVYRIFAISNLGVPIINRRFCQEDHSGLLYIGQTNGQTLRKRLYQFYASAHPEMKTHNHSGAQKYFRNVAIRAKLGNHSLWFEYEISDAPKITEGRLLVDYFNLYGEYPPLNK
jgi:hypothetical protein